jgi:hypothetical protein
VSRGACLPDPNSPIPKQFCILRLFVHAVGAYGLRGHVPEARSGNGWSGAEPCPAADRAGTSDPRAVLKLRIPSI